LMYVFIALKLPLAVAVSHKFWYGVISLLFILIYLKFFLLIYYDSGCSRVCYFVPTF
jgi:hypothetical protein